MSSISCLLVTYGWMKSRKKKRIQLVRIEEEVQIYIGGRGEKELKKKEERKKELYTLNLDKMDFLCNPKL